MLATQKSRRRKPMSGGARMSAAPTQANLLNEPAPDDRVAPSEGDTRLCMMGPAGAIFETDFGDAKSGDVCFRILWLNADASGFMDETNGDRILSVRY